MNITTRPRPRQPGSLNRAQYQALKRAQAIKDSLPDGQPVEGDDLRFVVGLLKQHPRAKAKVGPGIAAIVPHTYISGGRCFWIIRTDGTAEDFSLPKCFGQQPRRSARIRELMARFRTAVVVRSYLLRRRAPDGSGPRRAAAM